MKYLQLLLCSMSISLFSTMAASDQESPKKDSFFKRLISYFFVARPSYQGLAPEYKDRTTNPYKVAYIPHPRLR